MRYLLLLLLSLPAYCLATVWHFQGVRFTDGPTGPVGPLVGTITTADSGISITDYDFSTTVIVGGNVETLHFSATLDDQFVGGSPDGHLVFHLDGNSPLAISRLLDLYLAAPFGADPNPLTPQTFLTYLPGIAYANVISGALVTPEPQTLLAIAAGILFALKLRKRDSDRTASRQLNREASTKAPRSTLV